ncbi:SDR family oxidoreductase [Methanococcoides sp. SA1]|nr:SDR family oxidoreductase [Methanococcoides sp. SA1]
MSNDRFDEFNKKKILITGASSDIGVALIKKLIKYNIVLGAHYFSNLAPLENIKGENIILLKGNLDNRGLCHQIVDDFVKKAEGIDFFINFVGNISTPKDWKNITWDEWQSDININLSSSFFLAQRVSHHMKKNGGKIILISTASASHGGGGSTMPYGIAKAGVECMTKGMGKDLAKDNILVNCIAPGFIMTKFQQKSGKSEHDIKRRVESIPLKRAGKPDDIASAALYLLSDAGNYITGEILTISGGDWL